MGFLDSNGISCEGVLTVFWTPVGRKYLIERNKDGYTPTDFSLGDSDVNYINKFEPQAGFISDLGGFKNFCIIPTRATKIAYNIEVDNINNQLVPNSVLNIRSCVPTIDCSLYYDMKQLDNTDSRSSEILGDSIWDCVVGDFEGSLV